MPFGEVGVSDGIEQIAKAIFQHHPYKPPGSQLRSVLALRK